MTTYNAYYAYYVLHSDYTLALRPLSELKLEKIEFQKQPCNLAVIDLQDRPTGELLTPDERIGSKSRG